MPELVVDTKGKHVRVVDREFHYEAKGTIIKDAHITQDKRYSKFIQVIEWNEPESMRDVQEIRFCYYDRENFQRRPLMLPIQLCEELLNKAVDKGILEIDEKTFRIRVKRQLNPCSLKTNI